MSAKWVCLTCRVSYNRDHGRCARCGESLHFAGRFFKPPRRRATRQWQVIEILIRGGVTFDAHLTHLVTPTVDRFIESPAELADDDLQRALREVEWALDYFMPPVAIHDHTVPQTPRAAEEYLEWVDAERERYRDIRQVLLQRMND